MFLSPFPLLIYRTAHCAQKGERERERESNFLLLRPRFLFVSASSSSAVFKKGGRERERRESISFLLYGLRARGYIFGEREKGGGRKTVTYSFFPFSPFHFLLLLLLIPTGRLENDLGSAENESNTLGPLKMLFFAPLVRTVRRT